ASPVIRHAHRLLAEQVRQGDVLLVVEAVEHEAPFRGDPGGEAGHASSPRGAPVGGGGQASAYLPNRAGERPTPEEEAARIPGGGLDPSPGTGGSQPGLFRPVRLDGRRRLVARGEPGRASAGSTRGGGRLTEGVRGEQVGRPDTRGRAGRPVGVVEENGD